MQRTESRNELLEKWRTEKGRPPRPEKPWMPTRRMKQKERKADVVKSPSEAVKQQHPVEAKLVHTNFLKRRSGMLKWSHFGYSEDSKRRRVSPRLAEKENVSIADSASVDVTRNVETAKVDLLNITPSTASKDIAVKNELLRKTRRDLLSEWKTWKATRKALQDSNSNQIRRQTISLAPVKRKASPTTLRRQTMIISKKPKVQLPPKNAPANVPVEFKRPFPTFRKSPDIATTPRRQTMVIRNRNTTCLPKKGATNSSDGLVKPAWIPRCASQPVLKQQKAKEVLPSHKVHSSLHKAGEKKLQEQKTATNVTANRVRTLLSQPRVTTAKGNQNNNVAASTSTSQIANKGPVKNARSVGPMLRNRTSATAAAPQKTAVLQSKPTNKAPTLKAKSSNKTVVIRGKPSNAKVTKKVDERPTSKVSNQQNVGVQQAKRQTLKSALKVGDKTTNAECLQIQLPHAGDQPDTKSSKKSSLAILKTPSSRKSVAFEIPVHTGSSCKSPSLRRKLSTWLESQGRTPSAFRHLHCFGVELSEIKRKAPARSRSLGAAPRPASCETPTRSDACCDQVNPRSTWLAGRTPLRMINEKESTVNSALRASSFHTNLAGEGAEPGAENEMEFEEVLSNLSILLDNAYSLQEATEWLDAMFEKTQDVCKLAAYWECRAKISEFGGDKAEALALLAAGVNCGAQPRDKIDDMRARLTEETSRAILGTPRPRRHTDFVLNAENVFSSTLIKYAVKEQTPICKRLWPSSRGEHSESLVTVTPVRRSHRRSSFAFTPLSTSKHSTVQFVESLDDICDEIKRRMVVVPNPTLKLLLESPHQW